MPPKRRYSSINVKPLETVRLRALCDRDQRPPWLIIKDALSYYEKIHQKPRPTPAPGTVPRRGRPRKEP